MKPPIPDRCALPLLYAGGLTLLALIAWLAA